MKKLKIGDNVKVIQGKDKGKIGTIKTIYHSVQPRVQQQDHLYNQAFTCRNTHHANGKAKRIRNESPEYFRNQPKNY